MTRALLVAGACGAILAGFVPAAPAATPEAVSAEMRAICRRLTSGDDPYFGTRIVDQLRARLENPRLPPDFQARLRAGLGVNLLRLGHTDEAVRELATALAVAEKHPLDPAIDRQLRWDLAIAHLRAGEVNNCVAGHGAASCLLPFAPEAIHRRPEHAREAARRLRALLAREPQNLHARWLLDLAVRVAGDDPASLPPELRLPAGAFAPVGDLPAWPDVAPGLGVASVDLAGGAVMDDFDGDGLLDLVSSTSDPCGAMKAFRNDGRGGFEEVTERWGLAEQLGGLNLVHGDVDGDGRLDLLVLRGGWWGRNGEIRNSLLRNELDGGPGRFVDVTAEAGLAWPAYPTQTAAFADFDGDGDLDLYVGNEATADRPYPSQLFRNRGDGTFEDVTAAAGVANVRFAKGVAWGDYDDDGDPDLYVSNIGPNRLYRNEGNGRFVDVAPALGTTAPEGRSFATWWFDVDQDGDLDLFVADYGATLEEVAAPAFGRPTAAGHPRLYRNDGGRFVEVSAAWGLDAPCLPMGANHGDLDNDGRPDLYLGTGIPDYAALMPNLAYHNLGDRFEDATYATRTGHLQKGHGVAFGDLDNDGDQDLFHQVGGQYPGDGYANALFLNPGADSRWITLLLEGRTANRFGVGARIRARVREGEAFREVFALGGSGGSFGGSSLRQEIGLGRADGLVELEVVWPGSGRRDTFRDVPLDGIWRAVEGAPALEPVALPKIALNAAPASPPHADSEDHR